MDYEQGTTQWGNLGPDFGAGKRKIEYETPQKLFDELNKEYEFTLDVCASALNHKCEKYFTREINGLKQSWAGERCYMNPPYGREIGLWVEKAKKETLSGCPIVVGLLPVRADTKWFHRFVLHNAEIQFIQGRLKFNEKDGLKSGSTFASMICIWRAESHSNGVIGGYDPNKPDLMAEWLTQKALEEFEQ